MKTKLMTLSAAVAMVLGAWAEPAVTDITAKQRYPWNGLVDISCNVSGIEADSGEYEFVVVAVDKDTGREYTASNFSIEHGGEDMSGLEVSENGAYKLLWNAREDMGQVVIERMIVRIMLEPLAEDDVAEDENLDSQTKVQLWAGGPCWADRNIGASKPWKYGSYFWWGDKNGHRSGYNFWSDNSAIYTYGKSVAELQSAGWVTSGGVLAPAHDAAHVKWGGGWRMPTDSELDALISNCDWTWTTLNGVKGYVIHGRGAYASNSIFLPAAGSGFGSGRYSPGSNGGYWSSTPSSGTFEYACGIHFSSSGFYRQDNNRYIGRCVRPVQEPAK